MLSFMRLHTKRIFITILLLIIPAFCFFGVDLVMRDSAYNTIAGKLYGKTIKWDKFSLAAQETRTQMLAQLIILFGITNPDQLSTLTNRLGEFFSQENLHQLTWERLLLLELVRKQKIKVRREEIVQWISIFPLFQENDQFSTARYETVLRNAFGTSSATFEKQLKKSLQIRHLQEEVAGTIEPTQEELEQAYQQKNEKVAIEFVLINEKKVGKIAPLNESEIKAYYDIHLEKFRIPEQVKIEYLVLKQGEMTEELFYEKTTDISVALIQSSKAETAQKFGLTLQTTAFFSNQASPLPLKITQEAFELNVGESSSALSNGNEIYWVTILEKKPSEIPAFESCQEKVRKELEQERFKKEAQALAQKKRTEVTNLMTQESLSFEEAVRKVKLSSEKVPPFNRTEPLTLLPKEVQTEAFSLKPNEVSRMIPTETGALFFVVREKETPKYKEDPQLVKSLRSQKQNEHYHAWLTRQKQEANLVDLTPFF